MDGIILINKEKKYTSHDVVAKVKKILKVKVGHTGTLDPNATGILPLLLGNATKISKYLINHNKEYIAELKLGVKTDTADGEGKVIAEKQVNLEEIFENINESIQQILNSFVGKTLQKPPMYSAIKVNGKKLYEYARKNEKVEVKSRQIEIYKMELIKLDLKENIIKFKVRCSKGTYIRTLCEDIAEKLNTYGYMKELQRTEVGDFKIENAITIGELEELVNENKLKDKINEEALNIVNSKDRKYFIKIEELFMDKKIINLDEDLLNKFLNGVMIKNNNIDGIYRIYNKNNYIGIGVNKNQKLKRDVIV
jgi:tRNA pseudouridine55 synthase